MKLILQLQNFWHLVLAENTVPHFSKQWKCWSQLMWLLKTSSSLWCWCNKINFNQFENEWSLLQPTPSYGLETSKESNAQKERNNKKKKYSNKPRTSCSSLFSIVINSAVTSRGGLKPTSSANCSRSFHQSAPPRHSPAKINYIMIFWLVSVGFYGSRILI